MHYSPTHAYGVFVWSLLCSPSAFLQLLMCLDPQVNQPYTAAPVTASTEEAIAGSCIHLRTDRWNNVGMWEKESVERNKRRGSRARSLSETVCRRRVHWDGLIGGLDGGDKPPMSTSHKPMIAFSNSC